jgi:uncharacterized membrane protein YphA (DoxX/SURF4 family)
VLSWPPSLPAPPLAAYVVGATLVAVGLAIFFEWQTRAVALVTGAFLVASFVWLSLPRAIADCQWCGQWTSAMKTLTFCGGALLVAATHPGSLSGRAAIAGTGRLFFAAFLLLCGLQHFIWAAAVSGLVPAWIPGRLFWTHFAGGALIAGGIGILIPQTRRLAGALLALMIFSWVFLVHLPLAIKFWGTQSGNQTTAMFEALAFSGIGLMIAGSERWRAK